MKIQSKWELLLPDPDRVFYLISNHLDHFLENWWATFSVATAASITAVFCAVLLAILTNRYQALRIITMPFVAASQSFPLQSIAPLIIVVLGVGFLTKSVIAFVIAFFPIYGACVTALSSIPNPLEAKLRVCGSRYLVAMYHVRIPAAAPSIVSSAKVGFTLAVLGAVVAEFIQPDKGLGHLLIIAQSSFDVEVIYICIALLMFQGLIVYGSLSALEAKIIRNRSS